VKTALHRMTMNKNNQKYIGGMCTVGLSSQTDPGTELFVEFGCEQVAEIQRQKQPQPNLVLFRRNNKNTQRAFAFVFVFVCESRSGQTRTRTSQS